MARLGIFGGTFDPIHNGHLLAAEAVASQCALDAILFTPTGDSYQKESVTSADHRVAMVELAIQDHPKFHLETCDIDRGGATFTIDTLQDIKRKHPSSELFFILGTDALANIDSWRDSEKLPSLAKFIVVTRPGFAVELPTWPKGSVEVLEIDALNLSSTEIRQKIESGHNANDLVPKAVAGYISSNGLYLGNHD